MKKKPKSNPMGANVEPPITKETVTKPHTQAANTSSLNPNQNMLNYFGKSKDDANSGNGFALIPHLQPSTSTLIPPKDNSTPKIYKPLAPIVSF